MERVNNNLKYLDVYQLLIYIRILLNTSKMFDANLIIINLSLIFFHKIVVLQYFYLLFTG